MTVYLSVTLNGTAKGYARFVERSGHIFASRSSLTQLGIYPPPSIQYPLNLTALPQVKATFNAQQQTLDLMMPLSWLHLPVTQLNLDQTRNPPVSPGRGAVLDYDLYGNRSFESSATSLSAYVNMRAFGAFGLLSNGLLTRQSSTQVDSGRNSTVRLDTLFSHSWPQAALTLNAGDTLTRALSWSRQVRIAGIQIGRNFSLQPYTATSPLLSFMGSSTLPSAAALYINGVKQFEENVPTGPFQLNTLPSINGAGQAQVVLTDALGRKQVYDFSFYYTPSLLRAGLSDWSAALGYVRRDYGVDSNHYGRDPLLNGIWRYGLNNSLTVEAQGEAIDGLLNAGVGGVWNTQRLGVISANLAGSHNQGRSGTLVGLGYSYSRGRFALGASKEHAFGEYADAPALYGSAPTQDITQGHVGIGAGAWGSLGLGYVGLQQKGAAASRYANLTWSRSFGRNVSLAASWNRELSGEHQSSVVLTLTIALSDHRMASVGLQRNYTGDLQLSTSATRSVPSAGGLGWHVAAQHTMGGGQTTPSSGQLDLEYLGRYGKLGAGVYAAPHQSYGYVNYAGGLVYMDGHAFATQQAQDAFALVSTNGVPGVPVTLENRRIGTTDASGFLLLPQLNAYQSNKIGIDALQLPTNMRVGRVSALVVPAARAGADVRFRIEPIRAATVVLVGANGHVLPIGSLVRLNGQRGEAAMVGYDGITYLVNLELENTLTVEVPATPTAPKRHCQAHFAYKNRGDTIPRIGPLRCLERKRP